MVDYRYLIADASGGKPLAEAPFGDVSFSRVLSGIGQFSGVLPLDHPQCTEANFVGDREVTVLRDDTPIWNGPIVMAEATRSSNVLSVTAREASWWLGKRTVEVDKHYNTDMASTVRSVFTYVTTKTSTSGDGTSGAGVSINAALPRFSVSSGTVGVTKEIVLAGTARHTMLDVLDLMVDDPDTGLEYRMDYATGSNRQTCQRTLTLGAPLGVTVTHQLTEHVLYDFGRTLDWERGGTRAHAVGSGYTSTKQNVSSIAAGTILSEVVVDRTDTSLHSRINDAARELRRKAQPPVRTFSASFVPGGALDYGFCDLGDKVPFQISAPSMLSISSDNRRVVQIDVTPPSGDSPEVVALSFNLPLDDLGV